MRPEAPTAADSRRPRPGEAVFVETPDFASALTRQADGTVDVTEIAEFE